jgi:peptide-methionine (S)-S-oxide reductase
MFGFSRAIKTAWQAKVLAMILSAGIPAWAASAPANGKIGTPEITTGSQQTAVFAGGCFWGVDAVFKHVKGVSEVKSGYAGGSAGSAHYDQVSEGHTGHAEAVSIRFHPEQVSYLQLLQVFFSVAHDPTQLNHQGPDEGSQYRSAIFFTNAEQQKTAQGYIRQRTTAHTFSRPIVTQLVPLQAFFPAEKNHQNYLARHPDEPYIVINDMPKLEHLRKQFPTLYR